MYHNYYFLKRLAKSLNQSLSGMSLLSAFSQNKDELILGFANESKECYLLVNLQNQVGLIEIRSSFSRARKNSIDLFGEVIGLTVLEAAVINFDRSFQIELSDSYSLLFKMHGSRSNLLLLKDGTVINSFKKSLIGDLELSIEKLSRKLDLSEESFLKNDGDLRSFWPILGKEAREQLNLEHYEVQKTAVKWSMVSTMKQLLLNGDIWLYIDQNDKPKITFWESDGHLLMHSSNTTEINNTYYRYFTIDYQLRTQKNKVLKVIEMAIKKSGNYIAKTNKKLEELKTRRSYEEIANLLMANLHLNPRQSEIEVEDFYHPGERLKIKLNKDLSLQKNAESYYRKSKNEKIEINRLLENLRSKEVHLAQLKDQKTMILAIDSLKDLKPFSNQVGKLSEGSVQLPYKKITFHGFDILIGKNARSNDQLTLKVANKEDIWLHAKDVSGSHVIIKNQSGKKIPGDVLERAAELAAWHSKRQTDSLCPVIYTPKKYVRKRKGDPAGSVVVDKEKVILVTPQND